METKTRAFPTNYIEIYCEPKTKGEVAKDVKNLDEEGRVKYLTMD